MLEERAKKPSAYWVQSNDRSLKKRVMGDLKTFFRPEFLNRVDEIIIFNPLTKELLEANRRDTGEQDEEIYKEKNIDIKLTEKAKEYFAEIGFDPIYGARPLKRVLQREILNALR